MGARRHTGVCDELDPWGRIYEKPGLESSGF